jgi:hypothetical protein
MCGASLSGQSLSKAPGKADAVSERAAALPVPEVAPVSEGPHKAVVEPDRNVAPWWEDEASAAEQSAARNASSDVKFVANRPASVETANASPVASETARRSEKWWVEEQPGDRVQELREPKRDTPVEKVVSKKNDKWWVEDNGPTTVGGPSFLGLSGGDSAETGGGYSYLFQEEDERSHAGRWIALLILVIAAGVLYFKWQPIRDFVLTTAISNSKPKPLAEQQQSSADQGANAASSSGSTTTLASSDTPSQPTITTDAKSEKQKQTGLPEGDKDSAAAKADTSAKPDNSANAKSDSAPTGKADSAAATTASKPDAAPAAKAAPEANRPAASDPKQNAKSQPKQQAKEADTDDGNADDQATTASRRGREPQGNPGNELVTTGEKYLYGRGVTRSCDQAVSYFNAAAAKQNPQAYSHLGALYATGECVPMDRATAYAYFRRAYAKEPTNHYFEQNLTMLWREMSSDERQRATGGRTTSF